MINYQALSIRVIRLAVSEVLYEKGIPILQCTEYPHFSLSMGGISLSIGGIILYFEIKYGKLAMKNHAMLYTLSGSTVNKFDSLLQIFSLELCT